jgi:hypothetical protein
MQNTFYFKFNKIDKCADMCMVNSVIFAEPRIQVLDSENLHTI